MGNKLPITFIDDIEEHLSSLQLSLKTKHFIQIDLINVGITTNECDSPCSPLSPSRHTSTNSFIMYNDLKIFCINVHDIGDFSSNANEEELSPLSPLQMTKKCSANYLSELMQSPSWPSISNPYSHNDDDENEDKNDKNECSPS